MTARKPKKAYHHGELRQALLEASLKVLANEGLASFSLRAVAREAGVTTGAPYHHFEDRAHLLATLAEAAFAELVARLRRVSRATPEARLRAIALAYLDFARENPVRYGVMYLPELADRERFASLHSTAWQSMEQIIEALSELTERKATTAQLIARGVSVWATCHGFATLQVTGVIENRPELPSSRELRETLAAHIVSGALAAF